MPSSAKLLIKKLFGAFGLEVHRKRPDETARASMGHSLHQLARLGLSPATVIDVGVANATGELYEAFKEAKLLLIEPLVEYEPFLRSICSTRDAQYVLAAAGSATGSAILNVHGDRYSSSLLKEAEGAVVNGTPREVPVVTVDQVTEERRFPGPYLIKVDVQGAELEVLQGAQRTLHEAEAVLLEVSVLSAMVNGPELFDIVSHMKAVGFAAYDFCGFLYRPTDDVLAQVDMIFVPEDSCLRRTRAFSTPDRRRVQDTEANAEFDELQRKLL